MDNNSYYYWSLTKINNWTQEHHLKVILTRIWFHKNEALHKRLTSAWTFVFLYIFFFMTHISSYKWSSVKPYWPFHWWEQWEYIPLSQRNRPQAAVHKFTVYKLYHGFFALWLEEGSQKTPPFGLHVCYRSLHLLYAAAGGWTRDPSVIRTASRPTLNPLQGPRCSTFKSHSQERTRERERRSERVLKKKR